jgi:arabinofuranosyltransferase
LVFGSTTLIPTQTEVQARTRLPVDLISNIGSIGVTGYVSGRNVYIFDDYSLANPIGSHFPATRTTRPGHQKYIGPVWMIARFSPPTSVPPPGTNGSEVVAARSALACGTLADYLHAITAPFTLSRAIGDISHSFTFSRMTVPSDPATAERELCH